MSLDTELSPKKRYVNLRFFAFVYALVGICVGVLLVSDKFPLVYLAAAESYRFPLVALFAVVVLPLPFLRLPFLSVPTFLDKMLYCGIFVVVGCLFGFALSMLQEQLTWTAHPVLQGSISGDETPWRSVSPFLPSGALEKANFLGETESSVSFLVDGRPALLTPTVSYRFQFSGILPSMAPVWTGDFIVYPNGTFERLTVAQAQQDPRLQGLPIYPKELVQDMVSGYNSATNASGYSESAPILIRDRSSVYWLIYFYANPTGSIFTLFVVDARTGQSAVRSYGRGFVSSDAALHDAQLSPIASAWPWKNPESADDHVFFAGISLRSGRLYWHWTDIRNGQDVAQIWIDGYTEEALSSLPSSVPCPPTISCG